MFELCRMYPEDNDGNEFELKIKEHCSSLVHKSIHETAKAKKNIEDLDRKIHLIE